MRYPHGVTVIIRRGGGTDAFGDPLPGGGTSHVIDGCGLAPRTTTENNGRGDTVIVGLTLYAEHDADILPTDQVEVPSGAIYEVVGEPGRWLNPYTSNKAGLEVALQRVTG